MSIRAHRVAATLIAMAAVTSLAPAGVALAQAGQCDSPLQTHILLTTNRFPRDNGHAGECDPTRYGFTLDQVWDPTLYDRVFAAVQAYYAAHPESAAPAPASAAAAPDAPRTSPPYQGRTGPELPAPDNSPTMDGQCFDPVVQNAIRRVLKRFPNAKGNEGECNRDYWGITLDMSTQDGEDQVRARVAADPSLIGGDATSAAPGTASTDSPRPDGAPTDAEIKQAIQMELGQVYLGQAGSNRVQCDPDGPIQVSDRIGVLGPSNDANTYDGFAVNVAVTCKLYTGGDPIPHLRHRGAANSEIFLFYRGAFGGWRFTTRYYPGGS